MKYNETTMDREQALRKLGTIEAGFPSPAEEELLDTITLDEWLIKRREATYMLEVKGLSMMNAGILPGDTALVERGREPKHGDIVIACVDGKWTMKYYHILANKKNCSRSRQSEIHSYLPTRRTASRSHRHGYHPKILT